MADVFFFRLHIVRFVAILNSNCLRKSSTKHEEKSAHVPRNCIHISSMYVRACSRRRILQVCVHLSALYIVWIATHLALHHLLELGELLKPALGLLVGVGLQLVLEGLPGVLRLVDLVLGLLVGVRLELVLEGLPRVLHVALDLLQPLHLRLELLVLAAATIWER